MMAQALLVRKGETRCAQVLFDDEFGVMPGGLHVGPGGVGLFDEKV